MNNIPPTDWEKTLLLVEASIQAYRAWDKDPGPAEAPAGYEIVDTWTGVDSVFGKERKVEVYGIVLCTLAPPFRYVFSFRGTDSILDLIEDLGAEKRPYTALDPGVVTPAGVEIESGFADIYTEADGVTPPMREQVFRLLDRYVASPERPLHELWITGHSLGAALATLFSLDLALSRPNVSASNINFASPRVGNPAFVALYEQQTAERSPATRTLRVQNVFDRIPAMPLEAMGYQHLANAHLIAFHKHERLPTDLGLIVHNHAVVNYQAVLRCAAASSDGICRQEALPVPGKPYSITSLPPNPDDLRRIL